MKKAQKVKVVEELKEKLDKSKSLVLTDYRGLTHKQLEEFKRNLKDLSSEFLVAKNTLLKLALPDSITQSLETSLTGPTAVLFSYND